MQNVIVGGVPAACLSRDEIAQAMQVDCRAARAGGHPAKLVFDINGHGLAMAFQDPAYRKALEQADIVHADGQPIVFASRLLTSTPIPERSATTDMIHDFARVSGAEFSFYLLGGTEQANKACVENLQRMYPALRIVGRRNGYFQPADEAGICDEISRSGADILWVGLGKPLEQAFSVRNRDKLKVGWIVTCGGCFNYIAGNYGRAPRIMQSLGLEWLYRTFESPRKFLWRYLTTNPLALFLLLTRTRTAEETRV